MNRLPTICRSDVTPRMAGALPPSLTLEKLRLPHGSVPAIPLLAESLYLTRYLEHMGTGTGDMIRINQLRKEAHA